MGKVVKNNQTKDLSAILSGETNITKLAKLQTQSQSCLQNTTRRTTETFRRKH